MSVEAGRDLSVETTTATADNFTANPHFSHTTIDRVAGQYVTNPNGILVASMGNGIGRTEQRRERPNHPRHRARTDGRAENVTSDAGTITAVAGNNLTIKTCTASRNDDTACYGKKHGPRFQI